MTCIRMMDVRENYLRVEVLITRGDYLELRTCFLKVAQVCRVRILQYVMVIRDYPEDNRDGISLERLHHLAKELAFWYKGITVAYVDNRWGSDDTKLNLTFIRSALQQFGLEAEMFANETDARGWLLYLIEQRAEGC